MIKKDVFRIVHGKRLEGRTCMCVRFRGISGSVKSKGHAEACPPQFFLKVRAR